MNYIAEINAFYDWIETNPLPSPAINMWHALMHIANKTGWQPKFAVSISVLEVKTGLKKQALQNARNTLRQAGRIDFESRSGNQSAVYKLISLVDVRQPQRDPQTNAQKKIAVVKQPQTDTQGDTQRDTQGDTQTEPITILNYTKQNETISSSDHLAHNRDDDNDPMPKIQKIYFDTLGTLITKHNLDVISDYLASGLTEWHIHEALRRTAENNKRSFKYTMGILNSWINQKHFPLIE